ncbi:MAG: hypothetical protein ACOVRP_07220, partial [Gemmatimonas sp.]
GSLDAGATYTPPPDSAPAGQAGTQAWTGRRASIDITAARNFMLGDDSAADPQLRIGGTLRATGGVSVKAGSDASGLGISLGTKTAVIASATGRFASDGTEAWTDTAAGADGMVTLRADGAIRMHGELTAFDTGADIDVASLGQVVVDGLITADDQLTVQGGLHSSRVGILVSTLVLNDENQYESGGTLDTVAGGTIRLTATDGIKIEGVIGQRDLGSAKVGLLEISSTGHDVTVLRNVDVRDEVTIAGQSINVLSGSYVWATGANSEVYMRARNALTVSGALAPKAQAIVKADELVHLAAPSVTIMGQVEAGLVAVNPADAADVDADRTVDMKGLSLTAGQAYAVRIAHGPVGSETVHTFTETLGTPLTQTLEQLVAALAEKIDADAAYTAVVDAANQAQINVTSGAGTARISITLGDDPAAGRVLFNAGKSLTVGGIVSSNDRIDMNAGVDMGWTRAQLEGAIASTQLRGGSLTASGNGLVSAGGAVTLQAGGPVVLDAQAAVT